MSISKRFSDANFEYFHKESQISSTDKSSEAYIRILGTKNQLCIRLPNNFRMYVQTSSIRKVCDMASTLVEEQAIFLFQNPLDKPKLEQQFEKPVPQQDNISIPVKQEVPPQQPQIQMQQPQIQMQQPQIQMQQPQIQMQQPQIQAQPQFQRPSTIQPQIQMQQPQIQMQQPIQGQPQIQYVATPVNYAMNPNIVQQPMMQQQYMNPQMNYSNNTSGNAMFLNSTNSSMGVTTVQTKPPISGLNGMSVTLIIIGFINIIYFVLIALIVRGLVIVNCPNILNGIFCIIAGVVGLVKARHPSNSSTPAVTMASIALFFTVVNMVCGFIVSWYIFYGNIWYNILLNLLTIVFEIILIVFAVQAKPQFVTQQKELFLEMQGKK